MMHGHTNIKNIAMESITPKRQELVLKTDLKSSMWQTLDYIVEGDNKVKHVFAS